MKLSTRHFYISKRAKLIEPPQKMFDEIFEWAAGVYSRKAVEFYEKNPDYASWAEEAKKYATNEPDKKYFDIDLSDWKYADMPVNESQTIWDRIKSSNILSKLLVRIIPAKDMVTRASWNRITKTMNIYIFLPKFPIEHILKGDLSFRMVLSNLRDTIGHELVHVVQYLVEKIKGLAFGRPPKKHKLEPSPLAQNYQAVPHPLREIEFYPRLLSDARKIKKVLKNLPEPQRLKVFKTLIAAGPDFMADYKGRKYPVVPLWTFIELKPKTKKYRIAVKAVYDYVKELL